MKIRNFDKEKKVFIIAKLLANHSSSLQTATKTTQAAKRADADTIINANNTQITLLKYTSSHPTTFSQINLKTIAVMKKPYGVKVGFSDHTPGIIAPAMAINLEARIVKSYKSINEPFLLNKIKFESMVDAARNTEELIKELKFYQDRYKIKDHKFTRSPYVSTSIKKSEKFSKDNTESICSKYALHLKFKNEPLDRVVKRDINLQTR